MSKRPRKKNPNNPNKRYAIAAKSILRDVSAARLQSQITDEQNTHLFSIKTAKQINPSDIITKALKTVQYKWSVFIAVFCRDQFGKEYMQGSWVFADQPYYHGDLIDHVAGYLDGIVSDANKQHIVDIGWLSVLNGKELDHKHVEKIFIN